MASKARKLAENSLPDREHLFLTEFITWELDGVARMDDEVTRSRADAIEHDLRHWQSAEAPLGSNQISNCSVMVGAGL